MRRPLAGAAIAVVLSGCGSSPSSRELLMGTWVHEADPAEPDIPSSVTYRDDATLEGMYEIGMSPGTFEGRWSIDTRNFLNMTCKCRFARSGSVAVNYQVTAQSLTWTWGDGSQWHFHR